jgi:hypothetical protein
VISTACMCAYCRLGATLCVEAYTEVYRKVSAYCAAAASMYWETSHVAVSFLV